MPRFYFQLHNGNGFSEDSDGADVDSAGQARTLALQSIRSIVAEEALSGVLDLTGHVEITDDNHATLDRVAFAEAFDITGP